MSDLAAWCAGFLDGEGSFLLVGHGSSGRPSIQAQQVVAEPIERLASVLGGAVLLRKNRTVTGKPVYQWHVQGGVRCRRILPLLIPLLTTKRDAAQLLYEYALTISAQGQRPDAAALSTRDLLQTRYDALPERRK